MFRWNGWGDESVGMALPSRARALIRELIGEGTPAADYPLENYLAKIGDSRLPSHSLLSVDPQDRLNHSHGQSLPDWVGMRQGTLQRFPDGVAQPSTPEELKAIFKLAAEQNWIIIPYGGGTSVVGHLEVPASDHPVLTVSLRRFRRLIGLDSKSRLATFEAGVLGPDLEAQLRAHGFTLGHYPQSFEYSSLGGWVVTRSSGQQSSHFGRIEHLFAGGELITPEGTLPLPPFPASAAGPDLRHLVLGSEGRLGILSKATVQVSEIPAKDEVIGVFFPGWEAGADAVWELTGAGVPFSMIRLSNPTETLTNLSLAGHEKAIEWLRRYLRLRNVQDASACMCLVGFIGSRSRVKTARAEAAEIIRRQKGVVVGKAMGDAWKKNRFRAPYLRNTLWEMGYAVDTLETAVTWQKVTPAMEAIEKAIKESLVPWNENIHVFTHLSHVYPSGSSIYASYVFRLAATPEETLERWRKIKSAASRAVLQAGGTISHQHGVGVDHAPYLEAEKGALGMGALRQMCRYFDPENRMNPGKLV